ncbi:acetyltransferase, partial [Erythrobacter sp. HI0037]
MILLGIYGSSGFGREVLPLVRAQYGSDNYKIVFIDDSVAEAKNALSFDNFQTLEADERTVVIAIADSAVREKLAIRCANAGIRISDVRAPSAILLDNVDLGEGAILCSFTHLTSDIQIGRHFHANIYSYVAHDCVIGDYVTFAPSVKCNGNVHIDDHAYIGTGAIIKQGLPGRPLHIGRGAVVGMGAVVTKDVAPGE